MNRPPDTTSPLSRLKQAVTRRWAELRGGGVAAPKLPEMSAADAEELAVRFGRADQLADRVLQDFLRQAQVRGEPKSDFEAEAQAKAHAYMARVFSEPQRRPTDGVEAEMAAAAQAKADAHTARVFSEPPRQPADGVEAEMAAEAQAEADARMERVIPAQVDPARVAEQERQRAELERQRSEARVKQAGRAFDNVRYMYPWGEEPAEQEQVEAPKGDGRDSLRSRYAAAFEQAQQQDEEAGAGRSKDAREAQRERLNAVVEAGQQSQPPRTPKRRGR
jgi:hypothetical protein